MNNEELIRSFLAYLQSERGCAEHTLASYATDLRKFALASGKLTSAERDDVRAFLAQQLEAGSVRTIARRLYCLRHFYQWLRRKRLIARTPLANIPIPKIDHKLVKAVSDAEFRKMSEGVDRALVAATSAQKRKPKKKARKPRSKFVSKLREGQALMRQRKRRELIVERVRQAGISLPRQMQEHLHSLSVDVTEETIRADYATLGLHRVELALHWKHRAVLQVLDCCGLRASELIGLKLEDLKLSEGFVLIRSGKGDKDRYAPIDAPGVNALQDYLREARPLLYPDDTSGRVLPVTRQRLWQIMRDLSRDAGLPVHPHQMRHRYGTAMAKAGLEPREIADLMGHRYIDTTMHYFDLDLTHVREVFRKTHPRAVRP
jgi:site-specific recombinase XerD